MSLAQIKFLTYQSPKGMFSNTNWCIDKAYPPLGGFYILLHFK